MYKASKPMDRWFVLCSEMVNGGRWRGFNTAQKFGRDSSSWWAVCWVHDVGEPEAHVQIEAFPVYGLTELKQVAQKGHRKWEDGGCNKKQNKLPEKLFRNLNNTIFLTGLLLPPKLIEIWESP